MSYRQASSSSGQPQNFRETAFGARKISLEDVINNLLMEILLSPLKANEHGDLQRANDIMEALVLNLDALVYNSVVNDVLKPGRKKQQAEYEVRRGVIFEKWPKDGTRAKPAVVRELLGLSIALVSGEKLFSQRKTFFFSEGWQRDRELAMGKMEDEADKESLDQEVEDIEPATT